MAAASSTRGSNKDHGPKTRVKMFYEKRGRKFEDEGWADYNKEPEQLQFGDLRDHALQFCKKYSDRLPKGEFALYMYDDEGRPVRLDENNTPAWLAELCDDSTVSIRLVFLGEPLSDESSEDESQAVADASSLRRKINDLAMRVTGAEAVAASAFTSAATARMGAASSEDLNSMGLRVEALEAQAEVFNAATNQAAVLAAILEGVQSANTNQQALREELTAVRIQLNTQAQQATSQATRMEETFQGVRSANANQQAFREELNAVRTQLDTQAEQAASQATRTTRMVDTLDGLSREIGQLQADTRAAQAAQVNVADEIERRLSRGLGDLRTQQEAAMAEIAQSEARVLARLPLQLSQQGRRGGKPFIVVDGNLSSLKEPFLRLLMQRLRNVVVSPREDSHQKDRLSGLYSCTKNANTEDDTEEGRRFKDLELAFALQTQLMVNDEYMMCQHRDVARVVEHSSFDGEFVFRPHWEKLGLLSARQCRELTKRFVEKVEEWGMPDLFILLRVKPEKALQRIKRKKHRFERDVTVDYLEALEENFDTKYITAIEERGGTVIQLQVDVGDWTAEPEDLLRELRDKLRTLNCPRAAELREIFGVQPLADELRNVGDEVLEEVD